MTYPDKLADLLEKTSRTFALTIPLLPEPTRREVAVGYLMFRIIDSFEDATHWQPARRARALGEFVQLLEGEAGSSFAEDAAQQWLREPPLEHAGYLELIELTPLVLEWHRTLAPAARAAICKHVVRTAAGMARFVERTNAAGTLQLTTRSELQEYCFVVAGIVGELLTDLYILGGPQLAIVEPALRALAPRFGEGLQLVNILKDVQPDVAEGRVYLPDDMTLAEVSQLAHDDLIAALEYTELLRRAHADFGVVAFNALNARLGLATLHVLRDPTLGTKLTRNELRGLADDVMQSIRDGASLIPNA